MKIGIYDPYLDTMSGGEKYMLSAALCLADMHEVTVFWDSAQSDEIKSKAEMRFGFDLSKLSFADSIFSSRVSLISRFQASKQYDYIIYLSDGSIPLLACKLIVHFQSPMEWLSPPSIKTKFKLKRVKAFVVNSQFTKSYLDKKLGVSSQVIYPPVSLPEKKDGGKENSILNVGRFGINHAGSSYKKQEVLIEAFKKLVDSGVKDWKLVLVMSVAKQDQAKLAELQQTTKNYPIHFIINPQNQELWEQYKKAKMYWHASGFGEDVVKYPDRAEHFGISTVEAMGMGAVPIVINAGGQKEIVSDGENGLLWSTVDELLDQTKKVISNQELFSKLSEKAKKRAYDFSLEKFCTSFSEIIT